MTARVELVDHDPAWVDRFHYEREALERAIERWLVGPIEHVGSTAVPGLRAKPVIDIMAPVENLPASRGALPVLAGLEYQYWPYKAEVMHWLCKPSDAFRTHHLHLVPFGSRLWHARLSFRERLRADPVVAAEYTALKEELARRFANDREAYTEGKTAFVERVVAGDPLSPGDGEGR